MMRTGIAARALLVQRNKGKLSAKEGLMGYLNRVSIAVILAMLIMAFDRELLGMVPGAKALNDVRYAVSITLNLLDVLIAVLLVLLVLVVGGVGLRRQWQVIGLSMPDRLSLIWGAAILIPPLIIIGLTTPLTREETPITLFLTGIAFPMGEEIVFRGLATGILMLVAGWRFSPAAIIPSLFSGWAMLIRAQTLPKLPN
jgi:membrane protease YdiL (CAAX protease family)